MAIILKRRGTDGSVEVIQPRPVAPRPELEQDPPVQLTARPISRPAFPPKGKPKAVIKLGSKLSAAKPATFNSPKVDDLVASKEMADPFKRQAAYEALRPGDRVVVTCSMSPWARHYKLGDMGVVRQICAPNTALGPEAHSSHQIHVIVIDDPKDSIRRGQTAALFRWELEKVRQQA